MRAITNPTGASSLEESLGAYSHRERYGTRFDGVAGFTLTESEVLRVRRAVYGSNAGSARASDLANHVGFDTFPYTWGDIFIDEDVIAS